jgi:hypothetical protein
MKNKLFIVRFCGCFTGDAKRPNITHTSTGTHIQKLSLDLLEHNSYVLVYLYHFDPFDNIEQQEQPQVDLDPQEIPNINLNMNNAYVCPLTEELKEFIVQNLEFALPKQKKLLKLAL